MNGQYRKLFAVNMRTLRNANGLSQEKLGEMSGLHRTYISAIERTEVNVSISTMERVAVALGCELHDLLRKPVHTETADR